MNTEPQKPETNTVKKDNIPKDPSSPQVNPSFKPVDPVKKTMIPDIEEPDHGDHEKKYGYENEYNTV